MEAFLLLVFPENPGVFRFFSSDAAIIMRFPRNRKGENAQSFVKLFAWGGPQWKNEIPVGWAVELKLILQKSTRK